MTYKKNPKGFGGASGHPGAKSITNDTKAGELITAMRGCLVGQKLVADDWLDGENLHDFIWMNERMNEILDELADRVANPDSDGEIKK